MATMKASEDESFDAFIVQHTTYIVQQRCEHSKVFLKSYKEPYFCVHFDELKVNFKNRISSLLHIPVKLKRISY